MDYRYAIGILRICIAALLAGMLGACATTQRTSSGMGMIDDAAAASPSTASAAAPTPATQVSSKPGPSDSAAGTPVQATGQSAGNGTTGAGATTVRSEDIDAEKRALADEDARIAKLHAAQTEQPVADATNGTATPARAASTMQTNRASGADDTQAVFPENGSTSIPAPSKASNRDNSDAANDQISRKPLQHSVYFDFDKSLIKEQFDPVLKAQAAFLEAHKTFSAEIQGNCDERGSREYNLALGARRAEAVKQALELLGVDGEKIKTVSFGSEKPVALGKDEDSYSQNRRADIMD
jgi:peptidoglycan-associated lipoprotein